MTKTQTLDCKLLKIIFKVDLLWFYNLESKTSKGRIEKNMAICICNQENFSNTQGFLLTDDIRWVLPRARHGWTWGMHSPCPQNS